MSRIYGLDIEPSEYRPLRSVIESPQRTASGNIVVRVGREIGAIHPGWERTEHIVLTAEEAQSLAHHLLAAIDE
jgi:hypothetical protein